MLATIVLFYYVMIKVYKMDKKIMMYSFSSIGIIYGLILAAYLISTSEIEYSTAFFLFII